MEHAIATTFLPRSYCWTCAGYHRAGFLSFNGMAPLRIEHATLSLSWSERHPTLSLQHCGRRIHPILTQSTIAYGVCCRRYSAPDKPTSTNLKRPWSRFDHSIVDDAAIDQWRHRPSACVLTCKRGTFQAPILTLIRRSVIAIKKSAK